MTLKINDISIGDWVSTDIANLVIETDEEVSVFVNRAAQPARVKAILGNEDLVFCEVESDDDEFNTIYLKTKHVNPISITPEFLEKNGFEKAAIGDIYRHESGIEVSLYGDGWWQTTDLDSESFFHLDGVHHLQHLLRMYGVKEEVNL